MSGDIGYAYLQSYAKEKVAFLADASFGKHAGHTMIIDKAIYGLRSSGARYHERFATTMRDLGFTPSYADPDVWMRDDEPYVHIVAPQQSSKCNRADELKPNAHQEQGFSSYLFAYSRTSSNSMTIPCLQLEIHLTSFDRKVRMR